MEIPLASAKMTTSAVMKLFMAGLGVWPEWLWNTVTVGALTKNQHEGIHILRHFQGRTSTRYSGAHRYRIGAGRWDSATVTTMVVVGLIARDAGNRLRRGERRERGSSSSLRYHS
jgi:hypothetical protein